MYVSSEEGCLVFISRPEGARRAQKLISPSFWELLTAPSRTGSKPLDEIRSVAPRWLAELEYVFTVLFDVLARIDRLEVERARFVSAPYGPVFMERDLAPVTSAFARGCAERIAGNKAEGAHLLVNESRRIPLMCDCLGQVDVWLEMPAAWTENEWGAAKAIVLSEAPAFGVGVDLHGTFA